MHLPTISDADLVHIGKNIFVGNIVFDLSISLSKLSALAFYHRVFRVGTLNNWPWKWAFYITLALTIMWPFASILYGVFQCTPVEKNWEVYTPGECTGGFNSFVSASVTSVVIDIMILVLPLPMIAKLQLKWTRKLMVTCTFVLGYG